MTRVDLPETTQKHMNMYQSETQLPALPVQKTLSQTILYQNMAKILQIVSLLQPSWALVITSTHLPGADGL